MDKSKLQNIISNGTGWPSYEKIKCFFSSAETRSLFLIKLIIVTLPFTLVVNNVLILIFAINTFAQFKWGRIDIPISRRKVLLFGASPFFINLIGLLFAENTSEGWAVIEKSLSLIIFPVLFVFLPPFKKSQIEGIYSTFIYLCLTIVIYSLVASGWKVIQTQSFIDVSKLADREYYYFTYEYLAGAIGMSPIYLSNYLNLAIAFLIYNFIQTRNKISLFLIFIFGGYIMLLMSKMGVFILIFISISSLVALYAKKIMAGKLFISILLVCTFSIFLILNSKPFQDRILNIDYTSYDFSQGHIGYWNGASMRMAIWECSLEVIEENPWFGVGTGNVEEELIAKYKKNDFKLGVLLSYNAHNQYLQYVLRLGVFGALVFIILNILFPIIFALKNNNIMLFLFMLIYSFSFLTEAILERQQGVVLYSLMFTIIFSSSIDKKVIKKT